MEEKDKWYLKRTVVIIAILCIGPLALPLLWLSPAFTRLAKIIISIIVILLTILLCILSLKTYCLALNFLLEEYILRGIIDR